MAPIDSVDDKAVFVGDADALHSEWLESSYRSATGVMLLIFAMSGCEQLVRCLTHIAGNRLDLVMTDATDIVDVFVGTPLGPSHHCFISCVLRDGQ